MNRAASAPLALLVATGARAEWPAAKPADVALDAAVLDGEF
jgi:hypothetical protein